MMRRLPPMRRPRSAHRSSRRVASRPGRSPLRIGTRSASGWPAGNGRRGAAGRLTVSALDLSPQRRFSSCAWPAIAWPRQSRSTGEDIDYSQCSGDVEPRPTAPRRRAMKLLLVEDDADAGDYLLSSLDEAGHAVDWAKDGEAGLQLASQNSYDVVVLDRLLPALDGLDIVRALRSSE